MNDHNPNQSDAKLSSLLRESRITPPLPPRFQENVWRRLVRDETENNLIAAWLEKAMAALLRPRVALAAALILIIAGIVAGMYEGNRMAIKTAQLRYLTAVAPNSLH